MNITNKKFKKNLSISYVLKIKIIIKRMNIANKNEKKICS